MDLRSDTEFQPFYTGDHDAQQIQAMTSFFQKGWVLLDGYKFLFFYPGKRVGYRYRSVKVFTGNYSSDLAQRILSEKKRNLFGKLQRWDSGIGRGLRQ